MKKNEITDGAREGDNFAPGAGPNGIIVQTLEEARKYAIERNAEEAIADDDDDEAVSGENNPQEDEPDDFSDLDDLNALASGEGNAGE